MQLYLGKHLYKKQTVYFVGTFLGKKTLARMICCKINPQKCLDDEERRGGELKTTWAMPT